MRTEYDFSQARRNPFTCSHCGAIATSRHYDDEGNYMVSICDGHTPWPGWPDNITPVDAENPGIVSGQPTENGEFGASKATVGP